MSIDALKRDNAKPSRKKAVILMVVLAIALIVLFFLGLMVGSSNMGLSRSFMALFGQGDSTDIRIVQQIRLPRLLAALVAGMGLSISGLIMQSTLRNPMASPATLGVSNAAVFGANLSIIGFAGGFLSTGNNVSNYATSANPFATSSVAFVFAFASVLLILGICRLRSFSSESVVLAGIAIGSIWTAATTLLQYFATDVGLSAAVIWTFGDLGRATFQTDLIMAIVVIVCSLFFILLRYRYNALAHDAEVSSTLGINVTLFRFLSLLLSSLITAVVVSYLGIIGFVGIICPHAVKRIIGNNHSMTIPASLLSGAVLLLFADLISKLIGNGLSLPIGAITAILGGPFFLYLIFARKGDKA